MGVIRNIKASIDDKSSMSVNSITLLASALMGVIVGSVMCFVLKDQFYINQLKRIPLPHKKRT